MNHWESMLAKASELIDGSKVAVARQQERIERLKQIGATTEDAERRLDAYLKTVSALELHKRYLLRTAGQPA
jgi:hypothetical protein